MARRFRTVVVVAALAAAACTPVERATEPAPRRPAEPPATAPGSSARVLHCAWGGLSVVPDPMPSDFEALFAVVVVEIDSLHARRGVVPEVTLFERDGTALTTRRIVELERFARVPSSAEGELAYFLNPGGTTPWDGTLPAGRIRLRIRIALQEQRADPRVCRVRLADPSAPIVVERDVDGSWPT